MTHFNLRGNSCRHCWLIIILINLVCQGTRLIIQGNATVWYDFRQPNQTDGWVMSACTRPINPDPSGQG